MSAKPGIRNFQGEYRWLSNFMPCNVMLPIGISNGRIIAGHSMPTVEHAYQLAKHAPSGKYLSEDDLLKSTSMTFEDWRNLTAGQAKRKGSILPLRDDWNEYRLELMLALTRLKYDKIRNPDLHENLLRTGNLVIIETNGWGDSFWGVNETTGHGRNHLGKIIQQVRGELRDAQTLNRFSASDSFRNSSK